MHAPVVAMALSNPLQLWPPAIVQLIISQQGPDSDSIQTPKRTQRYRLRSLSEGLGLPNHFAYPLTRIYYVRAGF